MNTLMPERYPPCAMCGSSYEMHLEFPMGIRFLIPQFGMVASFHNDDTPPSPIDHDIMTCYEYMYDTSRIS